MLTDFYVCSSASRDLVKILRPTVELGAVLVVMGSLLPFIGVSSGALVKVSVG